eukprot:TRINITY_DN9835_c0_g1_i2.p1 TRINITY_DN9835_c0_g1~~TRINITY_DN9835_c0_g1_i2.p1  ORF type:complete len:1137 (-),score=293.56 TRINITY_DN9835_c0_g1_i2:3462-6470(-)
MNRATDDLYNACLEDLSEAECQRVIAAINCKLGEFTKLLDKLKVIVQFDQCPTSPRKPVAWDEPKGFLVSGETLDDAAGSESDGSSNSYTGGSSEAAEEVTPRKKPALTITLPAEIQQQTGDATANASDISQDSCSPRDDHAAEARDSKQQRLAPSHTYPGQTQESPPRLKRSSLHARLSSPERKCSLESDAQLQQKLEKARLLREQVHQSRVEKAKQEDSRVLQVRERQSQSLAKQQRKNDERNERADQLHDSILQEKRRRAESEISKVMEVAWISSQQAQSQKFLLQQQLSTKFDDIETRRASRLAERKSRAAQRSERERVALLRKHVITSTASKASAAELEFDSPATAAPTHVCTLCSVELCSAEDLEVHLHSGKHLNKLKRCEAATQTSPDGRLCPTRMSKKPADDLTGKAARGEDAPTAVTVPADPLQLFIVSLPVLPAVLAALSSDDISRLREKEKRCKKKLKKVRQRLSANAMSFEDSFPQKDSPHKARMAKLLQDLKNQTKTHNYAQMEVTLSGFKPFLNKKGAQAEVDQHVLRQTGCIDALVKIVTSQEPKVKCRADCSRAIAACLGILHQACALPYNIEYLILTNNVVALVNTLERTALSDREEPFLPGLLHIVCRCVQHRCGGAERLLSLKEDLVNYVALSCVVDKLQLKIKLLERMPLSGSSGDKAVANALAFIYSAVSLVEALTSLGGSLPLEKPVYNRYLGDTASKLFETLQETSLFGMPPLVVSLLAVCTSADPVRLSIVFHCCRALNNTALLDVKFFHAQFGCADRRTELHHMLSAVLALCKASHSTSEPPQEQERQGQRPGSPGSAAPMLPMAEVQIEQLLYEVILLMGYLAVPLAEPEAVVDADVACSGGDSGRGGGAGVPGRVVLSPLLELFHWGAGATLSTLLQALCSLPFRFFADNVCKGVLLPTLLAICFGDEQNNAIMRRELSTKLLLSFLQQHVVRPPLERGATHTPSSSTAAVPDARFAFVHRIDPVLWQAMAAYFA